MLTRPAVEAGEKLGFLPGDLSQKVDPYLRPLYDALFDLLGTEKTQRLLERQNIEIAPLAYMRGRTLNSSFVILDEAQNTTPEQMKMFLTRIGFGSRAVITRRLLRLTLPGEIRSGLMDAANILRDVRGISITYFTAADVVRHPLVARIVEAYDRAHKKMVKKRLKLRFNFSFSSFQSLRTCLLARKMVRWLKKALASDSMVTVRFVDEEEGRELNNSYRKKIARPTF